MSHAGPSRGRASDRHADAIRLNWSDLEPDDRFSVKISALVHSGCVGIGILGATRTALCRKPRSAVRAAGARSRSEYRASGRRDHWSSAIVRPAGPVGCNCGSSRSSVLRMQWAMKSTDKRARRAERAGCLLGALFAGLSADALIELAESLAMAPRLRPVPGWRVDGFKRIAEPAVYVRHGLWCAANTQHCGHPVVVPWHEGRSPRD